MTSGRQVFIGYRKGSVNSRGVELPDFQEVYQSLERLPLTWKFLNGLKAA